VLARVLGAYPAGPEPKRAKNRVHRDLVDPAPSAVNWD
jgi:hypothetical protein